MPTQLLSPSEALNRQFNAPAIADNDQSKKLTSTERRHGFWVGNIGLLLPYDITSEVSEGLPVCHLPNSPSWLAGMCNLRGNMAPIFDMNLLFNINLDKNTKRTQLFLKIDNEWLGVYSDKLPSRIILDTANKLDDIPPIPDELRRFVQSGYKQKDIWLDWNVKEFFAWLADKAEV